MTEAPRYKPLYLELVVLIARIRQDSPTFARRLEQTVTDHFGAKALEEWTKAVEGEATL